MSYFPDIVQDRLRFIVAKISNSRKEIEIRLLSDNTTQYDNLNFNLGGNIQASAADIYGRVSIIFQNRIADEFLDVVVPIGGGEYIPLVNHNYYVDNTISVGASEAKKYQFVIKLNKPLPPEYKKLSTINFLTIHSELIENEIIYAGTLENELPKFGNPLQVDTSFSVFNKSVETTTYQNLDDITGSLPQRQLNSFVSSSSDSLNTNEAFDKTLVDYRNFENFVFFSSAESRVRNFRTKVEAIESNLITISSSLSQLGQENSAVNSAATLIRNQKFKAIDDIYRTFTDYEKWLWSDGQVSSEFSAPGLGRQYGDSDGGLSISDNIIQKFNGEGFDEYYVLSGSSDEAIDIVKDKYLLEKPKFANTTGSIYLSFLLRGSGSISNGMQHLNLQTSSAPYYPMDSLKLESIQKPTATGSAYNKYIFKASGSHWVLSDSSKTLGLNKINFSHGSSDIMLTSGSSLFEKTVSGLGVYKNFISADTGSGQQISGSFVPKGDLFNIRIAPTGDTQLNGIITDVKVTENDPSTILPFHHLASSTSETFTTWYDNLITTASFYDSQNIQRLVNNVPSHYLNDSITHSELVTYVNSIGEFFDEYKTLVDNFYRLFNQGYSDYDQVPTKFNKLLAENLGSEIFPIEESNFLKLIGLNDNLTNSKNYSDKVINNVLNNLMYLYKTKGTPNSLKALLSCYGLPSNVLKIKEGGVSLKKYDDSVLSNDTNISPNIFFETASVHPDIRTAELNSIIINDNFDTSGFKVNWNTSNVISQSAIELVLKAPNTPNSMSLLSSYNVADDKKLWELSLIPSASDSVKGRFEFRLSDEAAGSSDLVANSTLVKTDFMNVLDNSLVNVAIQRSASGNDIAGVQTYELIVGKSHDENISVLTSSKVSIDGDSDSTSNKNFMSGSDGRHLFLTQNFTGSIGQIKSWSTPLSLTSFKQHIYNKKSIVGNNLTSSTNELQFYYPLEENHKSGSGKFDIIDSSTLRGGGDFNLDINIFNSQSINYDSTIYRAVNFPNSGTGAGTLLYSDNFVTIENPPKMVYDLNSDFSVVNHGETLSEREFTHTRDLSFERSPQEVINDFLKDNLGNLDFNDLFADPRDEYKSTYPDLDKFNKKLDEYNLSVDFTRFINATKKIFNNSFVESLKKLIPNKANLRVGNTLKPTYTQRIKLNYLREKPNSTIVSEPSFTTSSFGAGSLDGSVFNPSAVTLHGYSTSTSSLGRFDDVSTSAYTTDIDSSNIDLAQNYLLRPDLQNPQLLWSSASDGLHFPSYDNDAAGIHNDYNTYHYESDVVFTALMSPEKYIPTTSSNNRLENTDFSLEANFVNKRNIRTSQAVPERPLGLTSQVYTTSSVAFPHGRILDHDTRIPVNHISNEKDIRVYDYKGTKLGSTGFSSQKPGDKLWDGSAQWNPFFDASGNLLQEWEDLSTASFYRELIDTDNNATLRIVRNNKTNEGNNIVT